MPQQGETLDGEEEEVCLQRQSVVCHLHIFLLFHAARFAETRQGLSRVVSTEVGHMKRTIARAVRVRRKRVRKWHATFDKSSLVQRLELHIGAAGSEATVSRSDTDASFRVYVQPWVVKRQQVGVGSRAADMRGKMQVATELLPRVCARWVEKAVASASGTENNMVESRCFALN